MFRIVDIAFIFVTIISKETNIEGDEGNDDEDEDSNEEGDKDEGQFKDADDGSEPGPSGLLGNIRDSGIESLGVVKNCSDRGSDPSQLLSSLSTLPSSPSHVAPHLYSTFSALAASSAPLIALSTPSDVGRSHSNSPTAHTSHTPPRYNTSDKRRGRGRSSGHGRGHGRGHHRRSHSGSPPPVTFLNFPYSFSNPPSFLGYPQGPNFSLRNPGTAYTYFSLFFDDQLRYSSATR